MSSSEDAEAGEDRPAGRVRSAFFTDPFFYACLGALIWTTVLLVLIAAKSSVAPTIVAMLVGIVSAIAAIIGIFQPPRVKISFVIIRGVVIAVLIADIGVSGVWAGWFYYERNRDVDVLSTVALSQNNGVLPDHHATLDATVTEIRDTIALVFQVVDHNADIGSCVPSTRLSVTTDMAGNPGKTVSGKPGETMSVDLPARSSKLHLDIVVSNTRGDQNCAVDLSVESAKLQNKERILLWEAACARFD